MADLKTAVDNLTDAEYYNSALFMEGNTGSFVDNNVMMEPVYNSTNRIYKAVTTGSAAYIYRMWQFLPSTTSFGAYTKSNDGSFNESAVSIVSWTLNVY